MEFKNGKNYRLKIWPLHKQILPDEGKLVIKSNSITIRMKKRDNKHWSDLKEKKQDTSKEETKKSAGASEGGSS